MNVGKKPTRTKTQWTKAHWDKSPCTRTKAHLYAFDIDRAELMDKWTDGQISLLLKSEISNISFCLAPLIKVHAYFYFLSF